MRVDLVSGPSLRVASKLFLTSISATAAFGLILGLAILGLGEGMPRLLLLIGGSTLVLLAAVTAILLLVALRQKGREEAKGYTTTSSAFINLDTVDDRTGIVLRRAGEPLLTPEEYEALRVGLNVQ